MVGGAALHALAVEGLADPRDLTGAQNNFGSPVATPETHLASQRLLTGWEYRRGNLGAFLDWGYHVFISIPLRSTTLRRDTQSSTANVVLGDRTAILRRGEHKCLPNRLYSTYARLGRNVSREDCSTLAARASKQRTYGSHYNQWHVRNPWRGAAGPT